VIAELGRQPIAAKSFLRNTRTVFFLEKIIGYRKNILLISCTGNRDEYFPYHKNIMLSGGCMAWDYRMIF